MKPYIAWAVLGAFALDAAAQRAAAPSPADPAPRVPQASYRSAFEGYVPYREQTLAPWRDVNDEVGRVGGHAGIFRGAHGARGVPKPATPASGARATDGIEAGGKEAARGAPGAPADGAPQSEPASGGHHGH